MEIISIANSNDGDHFSLPFSRPLDRRYQIRFYGISTVICHTPSSQAWYRHIFMSMHNIHFYLYPVKRSRGPSSATADPTLSERCPLCNLTLGSDSCFDRHACQSPESGRVKYMCRICKHKTRSKPDMRRHLKHRHIAPKQLSCPHCSYKSNKREDMRDHMTSLHKGKWCTLAAVTGRTRSNLTLVAYR